MILKQYIKRPIKVEAVQFTNENKNQVYAWAVSIQQNIEPTGGLENPGLIVPTSEGDMICHLGDYLIKEPFPTDQRKIYPCKPDIFEKTYEEC